MVKKLRFILFLTLLFAFQLAGRAQVYGNEWINYNQQYYSFKIANSSIHKIEYNTLVSAGITFSSYTHENIQIFGREKEIPLHIIDNGDNSIDAQTPKWQNPGSSAQKTIVGKLAGENITKEALVNLVQDRDAPITAGLV